MKTLPQSVQENWNDKKIPVNILSDALNPCKRINKDETIPSFLSMDTQDYELFKVFYLRY